MGQERELKLLPAGEAVLMLEAHRRHYAPEDQLHLPRAARGVVVLVPSPEFGSATQGDLVQALLAQGLGVLALAPPRQGEEGFEAELPGQLRQALHWLGRHETTRGLPLALLGLGRGASAALQVCACRPCPASAVVAGLAGGELSQHGLRFLEVPALFIADLADPFDKRYSHHAADALGDLGWSRDVNDLETLAETAASWLRERLGRLHDREAGAA